MNRKIVENVHAFIDRSSALVGQIEGERFNHEMFCNCRELGMQSPIEDMFWVACHALCKSHYVAVNPEPCFNQKGELEECVGLRIKPQAMIGSYRVDFLLTQHQIGPDSVLRPTVVELDGHDFHDKDRRQRSYEKARDRFLVRSGYRVLHFTGGDVVADPFRVAFEALEMMGVMAVSGAGNYDPADPLGMGE